MGKDVNKRDVDKIIKLNGLTLVRHRGSHKIYKTKSGESITLTAEMNRMCLKRLVKEHNLIS